MNYKQGNTKLESYRVCSRLRHQNLSYYMLRMFVGKKVEAQPIKRSFGNLGMGISASAMALAIALASTSASAFRYKYSFLHSINSL